MNKVLERNIHLPDLMFVNLCDSQYGINRGVYNTIDAWLYKHGLTDILERRRNILSFLESIKFKSETAEKGRLKFGPGGLSIKLQNYFSKDYLETGT
ncbi:hypothetical protein ACT6P6_22230 [Priestia endophytica]|uniref:hypothetical protein n=1 Tax=Priestia endophytica TaxID=135735 RepID=UPI0022831680|nr:hypothetical protein [Priestia endophytica]MCY8232978.1 hypothetical protein [Priestia endophytica]